MTAREFLTKTMSLIGAISSGDAITASEAADGLVSLNDLLESWSTQGLLIPATVREAFNLIAGQAAYTIGVGGGFNTSRPMNIHAASWIKTGSSPELEIPLGIYNIQQWADITGKDVQSEIPSGLYLENNSPLATINLYPVPNAVNKIALYSFKPLTAIATLETALALPPGYNRALRYNLAVELAIEYGRKVSPNVDLIARESKADLMRTNTKPSYLTSDYSSGQTEDHTTNFKMGG